MDRILKKRLNGLLETFDFVEEREAIYAPAVLVPARIEHGVMRADVPRSGRGTVA